MVVRYQLTLVEYRNIFCRGTILEHATPIACPPIGDTFESLRELIDDYRSSKTNRHQRRSAHVLVDNSRPQPTYTQHFQSPTRMNTIKSSARSANRGGKWNKYTR
jgi:hypothetical protein